jgi:hypothetical protein
LQAEKAQPPRASTVIPRLSRASVSEPRPSIALIVAAEVATFFDVFGVLGVPMIIMFVVSAAWTFFMAAIQVHADTIANAIMNTTEFDNGEFWLLPKPDNGIVVSSVVLLSLFGIGYTGLAVTMIFFYRAGAPKESNLSRNNSSESTGTQVVTPPSGMKGNFARRIVTWARALPADIRDHYFVREQSADERAGCANRCSCL